MRQPRSRRQTDAAAVPATDLICRHCGEIVPKMQIVCSCRPRQSGIPAKPALASDTLDAPSQTSLLDVAAVIRFANPNCTCALCVGPLLKSYQRGFQLGYQLGLAGRPPDEDG